MAYTSIPKPTDYFNPLLFTGNETTDHAITGVGFAPNIVWLKGRSYADSELVWDTVRGASYSLNTTNTTAQSSFYAAGLTSFDADGFTLGNENSSNKSGGTIVAWNWKAGTTSGLSGGDITPSAYSINTTSGFGIYKYTGTGTAGNTIAHGLGATPAFMIMKRTSDAAAWMVYQKSTAATHYMKLDANSASSTDSATWNNTEPTSTLFTLGNDSTTNASGSVYISYLWAEKQGYSKFSSYVGNGNADGRFVYTGFRPAFVLLKKSSGTGSWWIFDNKRLGYNEKNYRMFADATSAETTDVYLDLLSNGFKLRSSDAEINASGSTITYAAFAEFPFVSTNSKPGMAR